MANVQLIGASIDVTKLTKERLIAGKKQRPDGSVGKYLDITFQVTDEQDQYGNNVSIWEGQSKEEREAKTPRNFLGNGKIVWSGQSNNQQQQQAPQNNGFGQAPQQGFNQQQDEDLPF